MRRLATVLAGVVFLSHAAAAQTGDHPPDTMAARVLGCTSCHGVQGRGTDVDYFPRFAGKPSGYLYNQLVAFRDGRRRYPPMNCMPVKQGL
jgi:cytochrome c553